LLAHHKRTYEELDQKLDEHDEEDLEKIVFKNSSSYVYRIEDQSTANTSTTLENKQEEPSPEEPEKKKEEEKKELQKKELEKKELEKKKIQPVKVTLEPKKRIAKIKIVPKTVLQEESLVNY